jgi:hypothetical protein
MKKRGLLIVLARALGTLAPPSDGLTGMDEAAYLVTR